MLDRTPLSPEASPETEIECQARYCPLNRVRAGASVRIKQLRAGPEVAHRLREIGFGEEQLVRLLAAQANVICQVCNSRLALSAALAELILVEPATG